MPEYTVTWTIELDADTPREAALKALRIHRDPDSIATAFTVQDDSGTTLIDLGGDGPVDPGGPQDPDDRPTASCSCGYDLIWIDGGWQHDAAPSLWGDDHDPNTDEVPDEDARREWDETDGVG